MIYRKTTSVSTLDNASPKAFLKICCACGSIVDLDKKEMCLKKSLKKEPECTVCRNARISKEIDLLNAHFSNLQVPEEEPY
jgi:hypothetical protein